MHSIDTFIDEEMGEGDETEILVFIEGAKLVVDVSGADLAVAVICITV